MTKENACKCYNEGYCKYKDRCMFLHPTEECDNNVKQLHALKPAEKSKSVEIIANINKNVNSNMTTNQIKIIHIFELKRAVNKLIENKLKNKAKIISLEKNVK